MTDSNEKNTAQPAPGWAFFKNYHSMLPDAKAHLIFWPVFVVGLVSDLWSKSAIFEWLQSRGSYSIIDGFLHLVIAENSGAAFGIAAGKRALLITVSILALIFVLGVFLFGRIRHRLIYLALGLFAAGICGNLYDRVFNNGFVRDFIDVVYWPGRHWPAFNVADSMLCIAIALMIISSLQASGHSSKQNSPNQ